ncbi:MAG: ABC transporter permease [Dehalococcoidia bacterium]|nr:ABC transporter permease [Dehalococcoidia bacterium]
MGPLKPVWLVARREILARLRTKAYRFSTLALVLLSVGGVAAAQALPSFFEDEPPRIGLAPDAVALRESLEQAATAFGEEVELSEFTSVEAAQAALIEGDLDAVLASRDSLLFEEEADPTVQALVGQAAYLATLPERAAAVGITLEEARTLIAPPTVETSLVSPPEAGDEAVDDGDRAVAAITTILLLMALTFYGQWVLIGVIEEKSSRVVEVLLATLAPWQLLVGKVLGILLLAVAQIGASVTALIVALLVIEDLEVPALAATSVAMGVVWVVLGLLLYNFLYAAIGATVNRPDEASSAAFPLMVPLMAGYMGGLVFIPDNPDAPFARALSMFPFTAPLTMPSRIASGGGSTIEVAIAMALTVATIGLVIWAGSRIYTGAILRTGKVGLLAAFRGGREAG